MQGASIRRNRSGSRTISDGNNTTMMLVCVVGVFLVVEFPSAVFFVVVVIQHSFGITLLSQSAGAIASMVVNMMILLSYPTNLFIYCAMSRAFRTTFCSLFCSSGRRRGVVGCRRLRPSDPRRRSADDGGAETAAARSGALTLHITQPSAVLTTHGQHGVPPPYESLAMTVAKSGACTADTGTEREACTVNQNECQDGCRESSSLVLASPLETDL